MTDTGTLIREDTGTHAIVRVLDGHQPASSNDYMAEWDAIERAAAAEFTAWLEGQWAQIEAETRSIADEQLHQHRQVRVDIAERARREGTVNLPPGFEDIAPAWAELPDEDAEVWVDIPDDAPSYSGAYEWTEVPVVWLDQGPAPDETMPGRVPGDGIPVLAAAYRGDRRFVPDPADYGPHPTAQLVVTRRVTDEQAAEIKRRWREMTGKDVEVERGIPWWRSVWQQVWPS